MEFFNQDIIAPKGAPSEDAQVKTNSNVGNVNSAPVAASKKISEPKTDSSLINNPNKLTEMLQVGTEAQFNEGMSVVPSNNGGRIYRFGFIEIIEDETSEAVDTEGMTPEELEDLRTWEIEKAADEGRLRFHEFVITEEEAQRMGIRFLEPYHRDEMPNSIPIPVHHRGEPIAVNERKGWRSLRPASRPNKKNKGYSRYK